MKRGLTKSVLAIGMGSALLALPGSAQDVRDFTGREPTRQELLDTLKPQGPRTRGIKLETTTPPVAPEKLRCAYYRKQASRGVTLVPESSAAALRITFAHNSADLTPESSRTLDTLGEVLKSNELGTCCFQVEGHTDSQGSNGYNRRLSQRRAQSVVSYMKERFGVDTDRLLATGRGEGQPIANNETGEGRQKNRRVQVVNLGYGQPAEQ